jgi:hypothetical protein
LQEGDAILPTDFDHAPIGQWRQPSHAGRVGFGSACRKKPRGALTWAQHWRLRRQDR